MTVVKLRECISIEKKLINPKKDVFYNVYSFPGYDNKKSPEFIKGSDIKSSKFEINSNTILFNKLNVKFKRVWNIGDDILDNSICSTEFLPIKVKKGIDQNFIYYCLIEDVFSRTINAKRKGTSNSQQRIDPEDVLNYEIDLPDINTQKTISSILNNLDRKICINNLISNNLKKQADIIYRNWFINDKGPSFKKRTVSLSDLMDYAGGSQPPASEFVNKEMPGYVRFVQIRDYDDDGHITYIPVSKRNKLCNENDIMIARYGVSLGRICFGLNGAYNVALAKVFPKKSCYTEFLRCYLSSREFYEGINKKGGRSAQAGFNAGDIESFKFSFPISDDILEEFERLTKPMMMKRIYLNKESRSLEFIRNNLTSKLLNGSIKV